MRIAFLTNVFPSPVHPTRGTFNFELARTLAKDHQLRVVAPVSWIDRGIRFRDVLAGRSKRGNVRVETSDGLAVHHPTYWYTPGLGRARYDGWMRWSINRTLHRVADSDHPDAVLSYWAHPDGAVAVRWAHEMGRRGVIMVGGSDVLVLTRNTSRRRAICRALQEADGVIAVSKQIATKVVELGVAADRVHQIYRGVHDRFRPDCRPSARRVLDLPRDVPILLSVGRLVPVKGLDRLLEAVGEAKRKGAEFRLLMVGDGPLRQELVRQAEKLNLGSTVQFVGGVDHESLPDYYQASDWTVLTSHSEGVPNVLLESHACGTPFIATAVGGVPEIVVPGFDRMVSPGDRTELVDAICDVTLHHSDLDLARRTELSRTVTASETAALQVAEVLAGTYGSTSTRVATP